MSHEYFICVLNSDERSASVEFICKFFEGSIRRKDLWTARGDNCSVIEGGLLQVVWVYSVDHATC